MKTISLFLLSAAFAAAQIASLPFTVPQASIAAYGGRHVGGSLSYAYNPQLRLFGRGLGSAWDAGAEYRLAQFKSENGSVSRFLDLGVTALYGSDGVKGAAEAGYLFGESADCYFWAKGAAGNYWEASGGAQIGHWGLSAGVGNYWDNRIDLAYSIDRLHKYAVTAGYSSVLGANIGLAVHLPVKLK